MPERLDRGDHDFVAAADREREAVALEARIGFQDDIRRGIVGIDMDGVRAGVSPRRRKSEIANLEIANSHTVAVCRNRSSATAPMMIVPVTICCTQFGSPCCEHPT